MLRFVHVISELTREVLQLSPELDAICVVLQC